MSTRLPVGGIIGCKDKTSSWHLFGFHNGSNIIKSGRSHRNTVYSVLYRDTKQNRDKRHDELGLKLNL